jgi:hypothetical protein
MSLFAAKTVRQTAKALLLEIRNTNALEGAPAPQTWVPKSQSYKAGYVPGTEWGVFYVATWLVREKLLGCYTLRADDHYMLGA